MDFKVDLSQNALDDLKRIVGYIATQNPAAGERVGHELLDAAQSLGQFPERGRVVPEFRRPELREIIYCSYRVIFRVNNVERTVEVIRIWHGARGFPHITG